MNEKILIIKLGAKGDVVRTLSLLPAIKKKYPSCKITWITKNNSKEIFYHNPYVSKIIGSDEKIEGHFDIIYCLDPDKETSEILSRVTSDKKFGFFMEGDYPLAFNNGAQYYVNTFFDDDLKRSNKFTVQEMMFMASDLDYNKDFCPIFLSEGEKLFGKEFFKKNSLLGKKVLGLHMGGSSRWPSRFWNDDYIIKFIKAVKSLGYEILLFSSVKKESRRNNIISQLKNDKVVVTPNNVNNTDREYFSLINSCDITITPDSYALHVSQALKKPTIALFFCTSADEIENYGLLKKIISPQLYEFFPQKMDVYSEELMNSINPEQVIEKVKEIL